MLEHRLNSNITAFPQQSPAALARLRGAASARFVLWFGLALLLCLPAGCSKESKKARHLGRAEKYFAGKDFEKARIEYLNVFRLDPRDKRVVSRLGEIAFEQGRLTDAFSFLKRSAELDPDNWAARTKLATIYLAGRQPEKARAEAILILSKQPTNGEAAALLADSSSTPQDVADAFQRILALRKQVGAQALSDGEFAPFAKVQALDLGVVARRDHPAASHVRSARRWLLR